jgi:hypothetical protein
MDHRPQGVLIRKDKKISANKIDAVLSSALAHEAALDVTAAKLWPKPKRKATVMVTGGGRRSAPSNSAGVAGQAVAAARPGAAAP